MLESIKWISNLLQSEQLAMMKSNAVLLLPDSAVAWAAFRLFSAARTRFGHRHCTTPCEIPTW